MSDASERQRFGRYETLFRIAAGGMAEVYAARDIGEAGFQKLVALKLMKAGLADDARFVAMFLDEGRVAANIASPNVVNTLYLGKTPSQQVYLVMELVKGASLNRLLKESRAADKPVPLPIAVDLLSQAAQGLHDAHEAASPTGEPLGLVHRDCSPHNMLVDTRGQLKITDFGIAKALERQTVSRAGEMKGKLSYLSPEQARGRPVDRRTDLFILGIVAWETLTGMRLFEAENAVEALHRVATAPIPPVTAHSPGVPEPIVEAVAKALQRDPDDRFATCQDFGQALLDGLGTTRRDRKAIGQWVRTYGGSDLQRLEDGIRSALGGRGSSELPAMRPPSNPGTPTPRSEAEARPSEVTGTPLPHQVLADGPPTRRVLGHAPTMMSQRPPPPGHTGTGTEPDAAPPGAIDPGTQPAGGATGTRPAGGVTGTQPVGSRRRRTAMMGAEAALGVPAAPTPPPPAGRTPTQPLPGSPAATGPIPDQRGTAPTMLLEEEAATAPGRRNIPPTSMPPPAPDTGSVPRSTGPRLKLPTPPEAFRPSAPPERPPARLIFAGVVVLAIVAAIGLGGGAYLATLLVDEEDPTASVDRPAPPAATPPQPADPAPAENPVTPGEAAPGATLDEPHERSTHVAREAAPRVRSPREGRRPPRAQTPRSAEEREAEPETPQAATDDPPGPRPPRVRGTTTNRGDRQDAIDEIFGN